MESGQTYKRLGIRTERQLDGQLRFEVTDNGGGITPEAMARLFTHGFTTKKTGHGFGLHASFLAAGEMGGSLLAQSEGPGLGARFTLLLPARTVDQAKEAA